VVGSRRDGAGGALTGHTPEQMDLLFQNHGRPLSWHQIFIGLRRGGTYQGDIGGIDPAFLKGLRESDIRPEWYNLAWAQRFTYPAAFVLRALVQGGDLTAAEGEQILLFEGWEPTLAKKVTAKWAQGSSAAAKEATASDVLTLYDGEHATRAATLTALEDLGYPVDEAATKLDVLDARRVVGAKQAAIGDLHTAYKKRSMPDENVLTALGSLGVAAWAAPHILSAWRAFLTAEAETAPTQLAPSVTGFSPASGPVGTVVTISGTSLNGVSAVTLGATNAAFVAVSDTSLRATVPAGAITGQWAVRTPGGSDASAEAFVVT
jgi:hypothetical protein